MPMIARRALPSRLTLVMRCTPTRDHICKKTHAHSPRQVAVAPSSPSPVGRSRACDPFPEHTDAHSGTAALGYSRHEACPRPPEGTNLFTKASDSEALSPAPPNRGMANFDEKARATGASVHITVCKARLHAPGLSLLPVAWLRATIPSWQPQEYWQLGLTT